MLNSEPSSGRSASSDTRTRRAQDRMLEPTSYQQTMDMARERMLNEKPRHY
jgi:hypothetical protein